MSQQYVDVVRRAYDAWNGQQALPALAAYLSENFEFVNPEARYAPWTPGVGCRRGGS